MAVDAGDPRGRARRAALAQATTEPLAFLADAWERIRQAIDHSGERFLFVNAKDCRPAWDPVDRWPAASLAASSAVDPFVLKLLAAQREPVFILLHAQDLDCSE